MVVQLFAGSMLPLVFLFSCVLDRRKIRGRDALPHHYALRASGFPSPAGDTPATPPSSRQPNVTRSPPTISAPMESVHPRQCQGPGDAPSTTKSEQPTFLLP